MDDCVVVRCRAASPERDDACVGIGLEMACELDAAVGFHRRTRRDTRQDETHEAPKRTAPRVRIGDQVPKGNVRHGPGTDVRKNRKTVGEEEELNQRCSLCTLSFTNLTNTENRDKVFLVKER
jgi:hypothetical protein